MKVYLTSYYPLCSTRNGKLAITNYADLDPYIDGSCRREPDFENNFPCITGLCRPGFANKLEEKDIVIYLTNKRGVGSRKVVAVLEVIKTYDTHEEAADFYRDKRIPIPNNLMVSETEPYPLDKTSKIFGWDTWIRDIQTLEEWNNGYVIRAENHSRVAQCNKEIFINLKDPIALTDKDWRSISTRALCTQNPPILTKKEISKFKKLTKIEF